MTQDRVDQAIEPEGTIRAGTGYTEDTDAEGHGHRYGSATEDPGIEPEGAIARGGKGLTEDEPEGGDGGPTDPNRSKFSDRNLKMAIVPVTW